MACDMTIKIEHIQTSRSSLDFQEFARYVERTVMATLSSAPKTDGQEVYGVSPFSQIPRDMLPLMLPAQARRPR